MDNIIDEKRLLLPGFLEEINNTNIQTHLMSFALSRVAILLRSGSQLLLLWPGPENWNVTILSEKVKM